MNSEYNRIDMKMCDLNYLRYPGWDENNYCIKKFFSKDTVKLISDKVTELTIGVTSKKIKVPDYRICEVMDGVFRGFTPTTGDIFTRYIVSNDEQQNMVQSLIDQTIEVITNHIVNELGMEKQNAKLTAWVQVYGDFNPNGLRYHPIIKVQENRPSTMQFNMNY